MTNEEPVPAPADAPATRDVLPPSEAPPTEDPPPRGGSTVQFREDRYFVPDEGDWAVIEVTRSGETTDSASVEYSLRNGSTEAGVEELLTRGMVTFAHGETNQHFALPSSSYLEHGHASKRLELTNPQGATLGTPDAAELIVLTRKRLRDYVRNSLLSTVASRSIRRVVTHLLLALSLIGLIWFLHDHFNNRAEGHAKQWRTNLVSTEGEVTFTSPALAITDAQKARLQSQLGRARARAILHLDIMSYFYARFYTAIITFSIVAGLAAIALVLISKRGWENTNEYLVTAFIIMAAITAFFNSFPGVFQLQENVVSNKQYFLKYLALEDAIHSFAATGELVNYEIRNEDLIEDVDTRTPADVEAPAAGAAAAGTQNTNNPTPEANAAGPAKTPTPHKRLSVPITASDFIHYVDLNLAKDDIAIGFDYQKVPDYKNAFDTGE